MRQFVFHIGEGPDDYHAVISTWPKRFGRANEGLVATAMRNGNVILTRDKSDDKVVGGAILDFSTYSHSLFVPVIWVSDGEKGQASIVRKLLEMVIKALILSGRDSLVAMRDVNADDKKAVTQFNKLARSSGLPFGIKVLGTVNNMFGDGRKVSVTSLFIQSSDRPDLVSNVLTISRKVVDNAIRSGRGMGAAAEFCSGCKESKEKESDKEPGKGEKGEKDGKELEMRSPFTKLNPEGEPTSLVGLYNQLGIQRFNRHSKPSRSVLLV